MLGDQKKGSSCLSGRSGTSDSQHPLMQSVVSMGGAHSEIDDELNLQGQLSLLVLVVFSKYYNRYGSCGLGRSYGCIAHPSVCVFLYVIVHEYACFVRDKKALSQVISINRMQLKCFSVTAINLVQKMGLLLSYKTT